jgi:hypothetical protein
MNAVRRESNYSGYWGNEDQSLSVHLHSRHEVADILRSSEIPTIEFRASIVIGSGSPSFEMIRALVQRLPDCPLLARNKLPANVKCCIISCPLLVRLPIYINYG